MLNYCYLTVINKINKLKSYLNNTKFNPKSNFCLLSKEKAHNPFNKITLII